MFNARSETVHSNTVFKRLLKLRRTCILLCKGFYEWAKEGRIKQPYYVYYDCETDATNLNLDQERGADTQKIMKMAALYDIWKGKILLRNNVMELSCSEFGMFHPPRHIPVLSYRVSSIFTWCMILKTIQEIFYILSQS